MIQRTYRRTAKIGFFAVAHGTYFAQFEGLFERLAAYHSDLADMIGENDVEVLDYGFAQSHETALAVLDRINADRPDIIFCNMITYATSSVFAPVIRNAAAPVVLLALQPRAALDYSIANTQMQLENDNICSVPEFMGVAARLGKRVADVVIGTLYDDARARTEIAQWCDIAKVLNGLSGARFGLMGHVLEAMYDMHTDPTAISAAFNVHVPLLEIDDLVRLYNDADPSDCAAKRRLILDEFDTPDPMHDPVTMKLTEADLDEAARCAVALDMLVKEKNLTGLAYYYEGLEGSIQRRVAASLIVGNSILNAQGIPMCGEYDLKTLIAMAIMDRLDIGGSFAEFHPFDFKEDFILVGHDGPHHMRIADAKPILRSLKKYHGKPGSGASVEFKLREGPITMLGITQTAGGALKLVIGEGLSQKGRIPPTGNTNTRAFFAPNTRDFVKKWVMEGPTHHYALGIGHHADTLTKIGEILGLDTVVVRG